MKDSVMTKREHTEEISILKKKIKELEKTEKAYRQMEAALRESEEKHRILLEESSDPIFSFTPTGQYTYVNRAFAEGVGKPVSEIIGKKIWDVFPREEADKRFASLNQVFLTGEEKVIEVRVPRTDGDRYYMTTITPVKGEAGEVASAICSSKDITGRRQMEKKLLNSEEKFRTLAESSAFAIMMHQGDYWIYANQAAEEISGYSEGELYRMHFWDFVHPDYRDMVKQSGLNRQQGKVLPRAYEFKIIAKNGMEKWVSLTGHSIQYEDKPTALISVTDVTERKITETALIESETKYRQIFESFEDLYYQTDQQGILRVLSPSVYRLTGWSPDELVGKPVTDIYINPSEREGLLDALSRNGSLLDYEVLLKKKDGTKTYASVTATLLTDADGKRYGVAGTLRDITERKQSEEALRERERTWTTLIGNLPGFVYRCANDRYWTMDYISAGCRDITGYAPEDFLQNRKLAYNDIIHPDYREPLWQKWQELLAKCEIFEDEYRIITASGEHRWVWERGQGIYSEDGRLLYLEGFITDITKRRQTEEEKAKLEAQLRQAQKMESVGRLAGGVAHDFNNMLGVIIGHAEMALMKMDPAQTLYADLMEIRKAAERSADLTRQLLAFARKQTIAPKVLDINEIVAGMLKMLKRLIGEDIDLHWQPNVDLWQVKIDPSQIDQIMVNLCINARDAISGVGKMTIQTENRDIDEAFCATHEGFISGEYVCVIVSDNGSGMDRETLSHLFEPFFTTKGIGKGTGLGLATVYGVVKQNNGFINAYSEPGQGTAFTIYLPRHVGRVRQERSEIVARPEKRGQETIIVAEDEPAILELTTTMLKMQGYTVLAASTPGEAIRFAREHQGEIHLLITDVVMPEMNGRDLAKNLLSLYPDIKRLFMSGYTANVIAHHGVLDQGVYFIQKPFTMQAMVAKVREVLDGE